MAELDHGCMCGPASSAVGRYLNIYFGSRPWYYVALASVAVFGVLLLTGTKIGLIIAIAITAITAIIQLLMEP